MINPMSWILKYVNPTVLKNSGLLILDKVVAAAISFIVYFVVANYLGPDGLGEYNYALSIVSMLSTFGLLGLDSLVVKDFVSGNWPKEKILGTMFGLRAFGSLIVIVASTAIVFIVRGNLWISCIALILSLTYLLRSVQVIDSWLLSQKQVVQSVISRILGIVFSSILKIIFVILHFDNLYFAIASTFEFVVVAIVLVISYKKVTNDRINVWSFDKEYLKNLLKRGYLLILGGFFATFVSRFDQFFLGTVLGDFSVGVYSPAAKISEIWYFVPMAFLDAIYPSLLDAKKNDSEIYRIKMARTTTILLYTSLMFCIFITIFADFIVKFFLKSDFVGASDIMRVYVWGTFGTVMIALWGRWLIIEEKQNQLLIVQIIIFALNILLNLFLVPRLGSMGAAWANALCLDLGWLIVVVVLNRGEYLKIILQSLVLPLKELKFKH